MEARQSMGEYQNGCWGKPDVVVELEFVQIEVFRVDVYAPSDAVRTWRSLRVRQEFYYCIVQCHSMV
jgi:hypothetical protein